MKLKDLTWHEWQRVPYIGLLADKGFSGREPDDEFPKITDWDYDYVERDFRDPISGLYRSKSKLVAMYDYLEKHHGR